MEFLKKNYSGILVCLVIAIPAWLLGKAFPVVGGPVIAILAGMLITMFWKDKGKQHQELSGRPKLFFRQLWFSWDLV